VFSPYYAWERRRHGDDHAQAEAHCALNVSLYRRAPGARHFSRRWAMTERAAPALQRDADHLDIGPSRLVWRADGRLQIDINEWTVPWPRRLRGQVLLQPGALPGRSFALDGQARHHWQPISPSAQVSVEFSAPACQWTGDAYLDTNHGSRPLARDFHSWQWQRSSQAGGSTQVLYDVQGLQGPAQTLSLAIEADGRVHAVPLKPPQRLPATAWRMHRHSRGHQPPELVATLESGPFYCRSLLLDRDGDAQAHARGGVLAVHESLSLQRFEQAWVQALLPFRMPRRAAGPCGR
jgi:carotenoid 1,2-hydratase